MLSHDELLKTFLSIFMLNLYPTGAVVGRARMVGNRRGTLKGTVSNILEI
jgi:hypothetical protein